MYGAIVAIGSTGEYGLLTTDHSASSYGLPVFVPLNSKYLPTGADARGSGEVGELTSCGYIGELPMCRQNEGHWTTGFREKCLAAGFRWEYSA